MDWFEKLTGFREIGYNDTRAKLRVEDRQLKSLINGKSYSVGKLELVSLQTLREKVRCVSGLSGRLKVSVGRRPTNASVARERRRTVSSRVAV
jgi:hypothetical protein